MAMDDQNRDHEVCLGLGLGLGLTPKRDYPRKNKRVFFLDLSIPIHPSEGEDDKQESKNISFSSGSKEKDDINRSNGFSRKKLRLTRDQTTLLEDSFKQHTTLNTAQKQALAEKLNLKPRQVEVWFQNRRARTKLKQTELDCEFLKKKCEILSEENRRLKKELLELRSSLKTENPLPLQFFQDRIHKSTAEGNGADRGGGETREAAAAAVMEGGP